MTLREKLEAWSNNIFENEDSDPGGYQGRKQMLDLLWPVLEEIDNYEYNFECDTNCQCCMNNQPLNSKIREALAELDRKVGK